MTAKDYIIVNEYLTLEMDIDKPYDYDNDVIKRYPHKAQVMGARFNLN